MHVCKIGNGGYQCRRKLAFKGQPCTTTLLLLVSFPHMYSACTHPTDMQLGKLWNKMFGRRSKEGMHSNPKAAAPAQAATHGAQAQEKKKGAAAAADPCKPVAGAITNLNYALLRASLSGLDASAPGIFLSPLSVYYALALALNGAGSGSQTHKQLLSLLTSGAGNDLTEDMLNSEVAEHLSMLSAKDEDGATMLVANGIFTKMPVAGEFMSRVAQLFGAMSEQVKDEAPINKWVDNTTQGEIKELIAPGTSFDTALVNALYFRGKWASPFDPDSTQPKLFHAPGGARTVSMMRQTVRRMVVLAL